MWHPDGPQGDEARKICHLVTHYTRGRGLDIGCGRYKLWPTVIGLDVAGSDITGDGCDLSQFGDGALDFVFSSHFLEHVAQPLPALLEWWRVVKVGGYLTLYLPHEDLYPRVGQPGANPDHKHNLNEGKVLQLLYAVTQQTGQGADLVECEIRDAGDGLDEFSEYSFLIVLRKRADAEFTPYEPHPVPREKRALVVRYGGYGDAFIASTCFPGLKAQGFHITVNCTPEIERVLRHNPYVDDFMLQNGGQVPDGDFLAIYFDRLQERFGRVILSFWETGLLPDRGRIEWMWPQETRHRLMNVNYMERMHDIAGVPQADYDCRFYGEPMRPFPDKQTILWVVAGSGAFKIWPHISQAIVKLLWQTDATILLVGGPEEKSVKIKDLVFEMVAHWYGRTNMRLHSMVGRVEIEDSCRLALGADVVVGPETGVLNAVASLPIPKVVLLSHSTPENLTKHWVNAIPLIPDTPDYPDHRLHGERLYDRYRSPMDLRIDQKTMAPELAANVTVDQVVDGVKRALEIARLRQTVIDIDASWEGSRDGDELHDAGGGEDDGGFDQEPDRPGHDQPGGRADGGASLDLQRAPGSGDAHPGNGHAGAGGVPVGTAGAVSGNGLLHLHESEAGRALLHAPDP